MRIITINGHPMKVFEQRLTYDPKGGISQETSSVVGIQYTELWEADCKTILLWPDRPDGKPDTGIGAAATDIISIKTENPGLFGNGSPVSVDSKRKKGLRARLYFESLSKEESDFVFQERQLEAIRETQSDRALSKPLVTFSDGFKTVTCTDWHKSESRARARQADGILRRLFENWRDSNKPMAIPFLLHGITTERLEKALSKEKYPKAWSLIVTHAEERSGDKTARLSNDYDYRAC